MLADSNARLRADSSEVLVHRASQDIALALTTLLAGARGEPDLKV